MSPVDDDQDRDEALAADELALLAYVDGELAGEELATFQARLRDDRALRARVRALSAIGDFLRQDADRIYAAAGATDLADAILAKVDAEAPGSPSEAAPERHLRLVDAGQAANHDREVTATPKRAATALSSGSPDGARGRDERVSEIHPATSRGARRSKNTVVWAVFGLVAAAAAAFVVYLRSNPLPAEVAGGGVPAVPSPSAPPVSSETIAVKPPAPPPAPLPLAEPAEKVENLEVSEGASIIYTQNGASVVWVTQSGSQVTGGSEGSK